MVKIEARKLDNNSSPPRPPKWGSQTTEELETPGTETSGKIFHFLFSRAKPMESHCHMPFFFFNHQKVPSQGFPGTCAARKEHDISPQPTTRVWTPLSVVPGLPKPAVTLLNSLAHFWQESSAGLLGNKLEI